MSIYIKKNVCLFFMQSVPVIASGTKLFRTHLQIQGTIVMEMGCLKGGERSPPFSRKIAESFLTFKNCGEIKLVFVLHTCSFPSNAPCVSGTTS